MRFLLIGFMIGFVLAAPGGPAGMICLRRTLARGAAAGMISAFGVGCADALWSFAAVHGLAGSAHWLRQNEVALERGIGVLFLLYGLNGLALGSPSPVAPPSRDDRLTDFLSTFAVVLLNPTTFVAISALFTVAGVPSARASLADSIEIAASVALGAVTFWTLAVQAVGAARARIGDAIVPLLSRASSVVIACFGGWLIVRGLA